MEFVALRPAVGLLMVGLLAVGPTMFGCGPEIQTPKINAAAAVVEAFRLHDTNQDGRLDGEELARCASLRAAATRADADSDGKLTPGELEARLSSYFQNAIGRIPITMTVTSDGAPLVGARVTLTPEPFLGDVLQSGEGATQVGGAAGPTIADSKFPGMQCGLFQVRVSKKDAQGNELIDARYNASTELGIEIAADAPESERGYAIDLSKR